MVRLKAIVDAIEPRVYRFQFHDGSIKGYPHLDVGVIRMCFNSTMVRLKVDVMHVL